MQLPEHHWHVACLSRELGRKPLGRRIGRSEVVLFRNQRGTVSAFRDRCPHRHARLSSGHVERGHLVCAYHGWRFDHDGVASCEQIASCDVKAETWEVVESEGLIWVRRGARLSDSRPPRFSEHGYRVISLKKQPLPARLDSFVLHDADIEHQGAVHRFFGYSPAALREVDFKVDVGEDFVTRVASGALKGVPRLLSRLFGVYGGDTLTLRMTTFYRPLYILITGDWADPVTGVKRASGVRFSMTPTAISENETWNYIMVQVTDGAPRLLDPLASLLFDYEARRDWKIMEAVSPDWSLDEMQLRRFDDGIAPTMSKLREVYYGEAPTAGAAGPAGSARLSTGHRQS